jgi:hypothetical protein
MCGVFPMSTSEKTTKILDNVSIRLEELLGELQKEGDRAAVILTVAKFDNLLNQLIVNFLLPDPGNRDELLDGPLFSFHAKILLCHRLGLIDNGFSRALHLVRKIRNSFAHKFTGCDLSEGGDRDRVNSLVSPIRDARSFQECLKNPIFKKHTEPAKEFRIMASFISVQLESLTYIIKQIKTYPNSLSLEFWNRD